MNDVGRFVGNIRERCDESCFFLSFQVCRMVGWGHIKKIFSTTFWWQIKFWAGNFSLRVGKLGYLSKGNFSGAKRDGTLVLVSFIRSETRYVVHGTACRESQRRVSR